MSQLARPVLHQRHRPRALGRVLHGSRPHQHQPHRDPASARGDRRAPGGWLEAAAGAAEGAGRALRDRHRVLEALREHPRHRRHLRRGDRRRRRGRLGAAAARAVAGDGRVRARPRRLPRRAGGAPPVARRPADRAPWLGQYCLNVTDIEATLAFYEALGPGVHEPHRDPPRLRGDRRATGPGEQAAAGPAEGPGRPDPDGLDVEALRAHRRLRCAPPGRRRRRPPSVLAPMFLDRWNTTIAFVADPDGYQVELVQRHPD